MVFIQVQKGFGKDVYVGPQVFDFVYPNVDPTSEDVLIHGVYLSNNYIIIPEHCLGILESLFESCEAADLHTDPKNIYNWFDPLSYLIYRVDEWDFVILRTSKEKQSLYPSDMYYSNPIGNMYPLIFDVPDPWVRILGYYSEQNQYYDAQEPFFVSVTIPLYIVEYQDPIHCGDSGTVIKGSTTLKHIFKQQLEEVKSPLFMMIKM